MAVGRPVTGAAKSARRRPRAGLLWRTVGRWLREERLRHGEEQERVAGLLNISIATYSRYENGIHVIPYEDLVRLADHYGLPIKELSGQMAEVVRRGQGAELDPEPWRRSA